MGDTTDFLATFSDWLDNLAQDAASLAAWLGHSAVPDASQRWTAAAINHLFKVTDLMPEEDRDLGCVDAALVLRMAAERASRAELDGADERTLATLGRLADDCEVVREFFGEQLDRFERFVDALEKVPVRGRSASQIVADEVLRDAFCADVQAFAQSYEPPGFLKHDTTLLKLRAFFDAKLPK